jgi:DDE family transposase
MGGIEKMASAICAELLGRLPWQNKKQREGLALLVATALQVRGVNLNELAAALPRKAERLDMRYQWISRVLGNDLIDVDEVMAPFAREVLAGAAENGRTVVVMIDQSKVNEAHQMIMVSLRVGERALPLAWRMKRTQGAIGFREQREALEAVAALLPENARVTLMGDRFYGSPALIDWCREKGWGWRLRCRQDLLVFDKSGGETTLKECFARGDHMLTDVELTKQRARTHVAMLHEEGHPEPWIIALSDPPTTWRAHDYSLRWGIEAMFSDYKTRGFNLEDSQIERTDRLDRLLLILSLALYWAVSAGMWDAMQNKTPAEKKTRKRAARTSPAA